MAMLNNQMVNMKKTTIHKSWMQNERPKQWCFKHMDMNTTLAVSVQALSLVRYATCVKDHL